MKNNRWRRLAALAGVSFVLLNVVAIALQGAPPSTNEAQDILDWFTDNATALEVASFLGIFSVIALLCWFGSLWQQWMRDENMGPGLPLLALAGFVGAMAVAVTWNAVVSTIALQADEIEAGTAKLLFVLASVLVSSTGAFLAVHLGAISALGLRHGFLPRWMSWFGVLPAALNAVSTFGVLSVESPAGLAGFLGFLTWLIWILLISVQMWRTADQQ